MEGVKWKGRMEFALNGISRLPTNLQTTALVLKQTKKKFGFLQRADFLDQYAALSMEEIPEMYEVVEWQGGGPKRLFFDIELERDDNDKITDAQPWLQGLLAIIDAEITTNCKLQCTICKCGYSECTHQTKPTPTRVVSNACRRSKGRQKLSFHVVYPEVFFTDYTTTMKSFVETAIMPALYYKPPYTWIANCKKGREERTAVDSIYGKNQAFRLAWSPKENNTGHLIPWDVDKWDKMCFHTTAERRNWLALSLVSHSFNGNNGNNGLYSYNKDQPSGVPDMVPLVVSEWNGPGCMSHALLGLSSADNPHMHRKSCREHYKELVPLFMSIPPMTLYTNKKVVGLMGAICGADAGGWLYIIQRLVDLDNFEHAMTTETHNRIYKSYNDGATLLQSGKISREKAKELLHEALRLDKKRKR
jgi:hypothetical protein